MWNYYRYLTNTHAYRFKQICLQNGELEKTKGRNGELVGKTKGRNGELVGKTKGRNGELGKTKGRNGEPRKTKVRTGEGKAKARSK